MIHLSSRDETKVPLRIYMIFWRCRGAAYGVDWKNREVFRKLVEVNFVIPFLFFSFSLNFFIFLFFHFQVIPSAVGRRKVTPLCINAGDERKHVQYVFWRRARLKTIGGTWGVGIFVSFFPRRLDLFPYLFLLSSYIHIHSYSHSYSHLGSGFWCWLLSRLVAIS